MIFYLSTQFEPIQLSDFKVRHLKGANPITSVVDISDYPIYQWLKQYVADFQVDIGLAYVGKQIFSKTPTKTVFVLTINDSDSALLFKLKWV